MSDYKPQNWRRLSSRTIAECRIFNVKANLCETADGAKQATFYEIENPEWCNIIPVTTDRQVVLIEQFRYGIEELTLEIPGGLVDEGEDAERAAVRELSEETGFEPLKVVSLGFSHPNPAIQNNKVHHFLALGCRLTHTPNFDANEDITVRLVPLAEIENIIKNGEITHSLVLAAFYQMMIRRNVIELIDEFSD